MNAECRVQNAELRAGFCKIINENPLNLHIRLRKDMFCVYKLLQLNNVGATIGRLLFLCA